ncbi:Kif9, partial [Symbiodinium sp. CCMP2456]
VTTIGPEPLLTGVDTNGPWKGVLYGFWPALVLVLGMVVVLAILNARWASDGSLGFQELHGRTVVAGARLESLGLLMWRLACLMLSVAPLVLSVRRYNAKEKEPHEILPFFLSGGVEILLVYFTLWRKLRLCRLRVDSDDAFGTSWLVFWAVWLLLLPFAYLAKRKAAVDSLLEPLLLYMHNANVILLTGEALFCQWSLRVEHSIFPAYVVLAYTVWNWWLKTKTGHWLYFFMDYNRPSMVPTFLILVAIEVASFRAGASLADLGQ